MKVAMFGDGGAKEILVRSYDTAFAVRALGIISGGENPGMAVQGGKLRGEMLAYFLDKATEQAPHIMPIGMMGCAMDPMREGITA